MTYPVGYRTPYARSMGSYQPRAAARGVIPSRAVAIPAPRLPQLPRIPSVGPWGIPVVAGAIAGKWLYDRWNEDEKKQGPIPGHQVNVPAGWEYCGTCGICGDATHGWSQMLSANCSVASEDLCLFGQSLGGVAYDFGAAFGQTGARVVYLIDRTTPHPCQKPFLTPDMLTVSFIRPGDAVTNPDFGPQPPVATILPKPGLRTWAPGSPGIGTFPPFVIPFPTKPGVKQPPVVDWPESSIWGPGAASLKRELTIRYGEKAVPGAVPLAGPTIGVTVRPLGRAQTRTRYAVGAVAVVPKADADTRHPRPPGRNVKEQKLKMSAGYSIAWRIFSFVGESVDMVEAFHKALDKECLRQKRSLWRHTNRVYVSERYVTAWLLRAKTPQAKAWDVWNNFDCLDGGQALRNIGFNEFQDRLFGKAGRLLKGARQHAVDQGYLHDRPGFQVGPWDTILRDNSEAVSKADQNRQARNLP